jgi:aspartate-semialdehyde dehydrogenase
MRRWEGRLGADELPSAPPRPLEVLDGEAAPQPRLHAARGGGMTVTVGRLRRCPVLGLRYVALVHNTERGAAGAAVLNAELVVTRTAQPPNRACRVKRET